MNVSVVLYMSKKERERERDDQRTAVIEYPSGSVNSLPKVRILYMRGEKRNRRNRTEFKLTYAEHNSAGGAIKTNTVG